MGRAKQRKLMRQLAIATNERRPAGPGWSQIPVPERLRASFGRCPMSAWQKGEICVLSTLERAELPDRSGIGQQWHVSVSRRGQGRSSDHECGEALNAFGLVGAEEDNHHPGITRNFWLPVDPTRRVDCECKETERTIAEPDGYRWTNPREGACRGCELENMIGLRCPLHGLGNVTKDHRP